MSNLEYKVIASCNDCEFQPICKKQYDKHKAAACNMLGKDLSPRAAQAVFIAKQTLEKPAPKPDAQTGIMRVTMNMYTPDVALPEDCRPLLLVLPKKNGDGTIKTVGTFTKTVGFCLSTIDSENPYLIPCQPMLWAYLTEGSEVFK